MIIKINAKCSDMFSAQLFTKEGNQVGKDYDGYVPDFFPGEHYGDYIELEIDTKTGKILNWTEPEDAELMDLFDTAEEEE